jgi:polysaccharide pyruvyl transferase WcaK-like protein
MDLALAGWVSGLVESARLESKWTRTPAEPTNLPLKLLFVGYNGARNTGSDVRVEEMVRQFRHLFGSHVRATVVTQNPSLTDGYFAGADQVHAPDVFPQFLFRQVGEHDGVVACEGSMFKSTFANALSAMMFEGLGVAAAQHKLSIAYGAEAGEMDWVLRAMCRRYCADSFVITRSEESQRTVEQYGVRNVICGTDTAWTFEPHSTDIGARALKQAGWRDGQRLLIVCPTNPFWWPVKASLTKTAARAVTGAYHRGHYRTIYFHRSDAAVWSAFERYIAALAGAIERVRREHRVFTALVAMEAIDTDACSQLSDALGGGVPIFTSRNTDMFRLVSVLRCADAIVSSRYHAIVTSMPALVPSAGIAMDERIRGLMTDRGHEHLLAHCTDPDLEDRVFAMIGTLLRDRDALRAEIANATVAHLRRMARMGEDLVSYVRGRHPQIPEPTIRSWIDYLPPLSARLRDLLEVAVPS